MKEESSVKQNGGKYKSPARKLITFFERSRNNWKTKCQDAKYQIKKLKKRLQYTEERKKELKYKVKELKKEVSRLQLRESALKEEVKHLKKRHL